MKALTTTKIIIVFLFVIIIHLTISGKGGCFGEKKRHDKVGSSSTSLIYTPYNLVATAVSSSQVYLTWFDDSNNEDGFAIERRTAITDYSQVAIVGSDISDYLDTGLNWDTTYFYRVVAYNTAGYSLYSDEVSTDFTKFAPSLLSATVMFPTKINLAWTDNSFDETGFKIERKSVSNDIWTEIGTVDFNISSYSDISETGFASSVYYYRVQAYNYAGNSSSSNEASVLVTRSTIAAGSFHSLAIKSDGVLWAWGGNYSGQLGLGDNGYGTERWTPTQIVTDSDWLAIIAGYNHTLALKNNRTLWVWGNNESGQLGLGYWNINSITDPTQLGSDTDWSTLAGGEDFTIALRTNGSLWAWGDNEYGQLGLGDSWWSADRITPSQVGTDTDWSVVAAGDKWSCARKTDGTLWSWGWNLNGQLGLGYTTDPWTGPYVVVPTQIGTDSDWSAVIMGGVHTLATKTSGTLWSWGDNSYGQLGFGYTSTDPVTTPIQIGSNSDWSALAAGWVYTLAIKTNGTLWSWGYNSYGQLGLGYTSANSVTNPTQIGSNSDWYTIKAGFDHNLATKTNGTIWSWGLNNAGQLGLGESVGRVITTPTQVRE